MACSLFPTTQTKQGQSFTFTHTLSPDWYGLGNKSSESMRTLIFETKWYYHQTILRWITWGLKKWPLKIRCFLMSLFGRVFHFHYNQVINQCPINDNTGLGDGLVPNAVAWTNADRSVMHNCLTRGYVSIVQNKSTTLWYHDMETFSTLLAIYKGKPLIMGGFPLQRVSNVGLFFSSLLICIFIILWHIDG